MSHANVLEELTRPAQDRCAQHPVVGVPPEFDPARIRTLVPRGVPVAVADPAAGDMTALLDEARHFTVWIGSPRHDSLRRYLRTARTGGRPRGLYLWLTGYLEPGFVAYRVPLVGVLAAIAAALLQGSEGFTSVWATGLAIVIVAGVVLAVEPSVTAAVRYARVVRVWHRMESDTPHRGGSLAEATRHWWKQLAAGRAVADPRCDRLLAGAYLADLSGAWHPRLWQPSWWFAARRTDYPVLIIGPGPVESGPVDVLLDAYRRLRWRSVVLVLPEPLRLPAGPPDPVLLPATAEPPGEQRAVAPTPPWFQRRRWRGLGGVVLASVLLLGSWTGLAQMASAFDPCTREDDEVVEIGTERIGFQVCGTELFWRADGWGDKPSVGAEDGTWEDQIYAENVRVSEQEKAGRETLTILVVTSLTRRTKDSSVVPETEGLAGAYAAQREINGNEQIPLLRLAIVNTGDRGLLISEALEEVAGYVADSDNRVVGALTTVDSTTISKAALKTLDDAGLVQLSPTMTADGIGAEMKRFYQLISPNALQTELVVEYAITRSRVDRRDAAAFSFAAPGDRLTGDDIEGEQHDLYIQSLREGVRRQKKRLAGAGMPLAEIPWESSGGDLSQACATSERYSVVYFGGRYTDFTEFVEDLHDACAKAKPPLLIANSSVSRFLMDPGLAGDVRHGASVTMATRGPLLSCDQYRTKALDRADVGRRRDFADAIDQFLGRCGDQTANGDGSDALAGGWTANAYEAVSLLHAAARRDRATGDRAAEEDSIRDIRNRADAALAGNEIADRGVESPVSFRGRVGSQSVWLYQVKDLRTAFEGGRSPAGGSATPVACAGDTYEKCRKLSGGR